MIIEIGHFAMILACLVAIVQSSLPLVGAARREPGLMAVGQTAALTQFALIAVAFATLIHAYVTSDFSALNVAENSHSDKPLLYKVTGVWGNHEGSMVLWVFMLGLCGAAVALFGGNLPPALKARVLAVQGMIGTGFLLFILLTSNPFLRAPPAPEDGRGLNPVLQDPGLAFHPPFLYLGYVGFSVSFSFAVAALIEGRVDAAWGRWVRPWALFSLARPAVGIAMGSWWAYYTLGWGGWWYWDPVENASFMPWLVGTALIYSAIVVEKREGLKSWTILLAILTFSLSLVGTFLVRSGVLTSVHAFAVDPARGMFILLLLLVAIGGSLTLYAVRAPSLKGGSGLFAPISREGALVLNNLLLTTVAATVFVGTLYPLFLDAVGGRLSGGFPFFNRNRTPDGADADRAGGRPPARLEARRPVGRAAAALGGAGGGHRGGVGRAGDHRWRACVGAARSRPRRLAVRRFAHRMGGARQPVQGTAARHIAPRLTPAPLGLLDDAGPYRRRRIGGRLRSLGIRLRAHRYRGARPRPRHRRLCAASRQRQQGTGRQFHRRRCADFGQP